LSVLAVLIVAIVAGVFTAACSRLCQPKRTEESVAKGTTTTTTSSTSTTRPAKVIDVRETKRGQPVPRNLLE
jgi:hypothetical protein